MCPIQYFYLLFKLMLSSYYIDLVFGIKKVVSHYVL